MRWHTITLKYPAELTEDQENILVVNWREVRRLTGKELERQARKTGNIMPVLKAADKIAGGPVAETQATVMSTAMKSVADDIQSHFALDRRNGREYVLMISEAAIPEGGRVAFNILGRRLTLADMMKTIAHKFWSGVSVDMGFRKEDVQYEIGMC